MFGLNGRNEIEEMRSRYSAMVNVLSDILSCGRWDIETLFDSENNIEVGEIVRNYVDETGRLPNWNTVYYEAIAEFASEHNLDLDKDIAIYTNACIDTHIYARDGLDPDTVEELQDLFGMEVETLCSSRFALPRSYSANVK